MQKTHVIQNLALSIGLLALAACGPSATEAETQTAPGPLVQVVAVQPLSAAGTIRASGLVGYKREPQLAFAAPGIVGALDVDAGDTVRRGQRLATLRRTSVGSNADEAAQVPDAKVHAADNLLAVCAHLRGDAGLPRCTATPIPPSLASVPDLADDCPGVAQKYGIRSVPTVLVFKGGERKAQHVGLTTKENLLKLLES